MMMIYESINPKYDGFDKIDSILDFAKIVRSGGVYDFIIRRHIDKYGLKRDFNVTWTPEINIGNYIPNYRIATDIARYNSAGLGNEIDYLLDVHPLGIMPGTSSYKLADEIGNINNPGYSNFPSIYTKRRIIEIPGLSK